jgi:hypothetical protein
LAKDGKRSFVPVPAFDLLNTPLERFGEKIAMRHIPGRLLIGLTVTAVIGLAWPRSHVAGKPAELAETAPPRAEDHSWNAAANQEATWMGVASCASSSCHHENGPKGSKRSEYDTWAGYDKHARAFQVLYNERSERIARNLYGDAGKPAPEQPLCLKCHSAHEGVTDKGVGERFQLADGVSCESCHGAAEKWLTVHYQDDFKSKSLEEKAAFGLRPTKDILHRAQLCTTCHVGSADKEVNHDLIAAGHPRLAFELGAYHGIYNKHWDIHDDHARYKDFEARLWSVGQLVSARAALELLASRASGATKEGKDAKPWPEFSEYDCFACHKGLTVIDVNSDREKLKYIGRRPGNLPWGDWYLSPTNPLTGDLGMRQADESDPVQELRELLQSPTPVASKEAPFTRELTGRIDGVLKGLQPDRPAEGVQTRELLRRLLQVGKDRAKGMSWDEAAQLYLALAAMENELNDLRPAYPSPAVKDRLAKMAKTLQEAFPKKSDSPSRFNPTALETDLKSISAKFGD